MQKKAILYKKLSSSLVQCTCCSHYCVIKSWESWKCSIRKNISWDLYLLNYWRILGLNIDPVEKKPLFHFLPWARVLSFWTASCNFTCQFCQNWHMSQLRKDNKDYWKRFGDNYEEALEKIWDEVNPEAIVDFAVKNNIEAIAYTYNEPTIFFEFLKDVSLLAKKRWIRTIMVSNWFQTKEFWEEAKEFIDAINIDLKAWSNEFYKEICDWRIKPIKENIKRIFKETNTFVEITTLIIPGENDSEEDLKNMASFIKNISSDIPWHISAFHPDWKMLDKEVTPLSTILKAYNIGKEVGLNYIYAGNVNVPKLETTYCPKCGEELITRSGFVGEKVIDKTLRTWVCPRCNTKIVGCFVENGKFVIRKETIFNK